VVVFHPANREVDRKGLSNDPNTELGVGK